MKGGISVSSIVKYHLRQETPMWHFQCRESGSQVGAIIRGSDVKPRLDKFLICEMKKTGIDWEQFKISENHDALNYKMQIVANGSTSKKDMGQNAFFANIGRNVDKEVAVFYPQGVDVKITCFIPELMEQIDKHIQGFFLLNNFGTRQDKGFGSFVIEKVDNKIVKDEYDKLLVKYSSNQGYCAYKVDVSNCTNDMVLDNIYVLYQWIKSGINFGGTYKKSLLTEYMLEKGIGGEKRWMKENGIAPKVKKDPNDKKRVISDERIQSGTVNEEKYIRAVLGVSGNQSWINLNQNRTTISVSSTDIKRFQSTIMIKLINGQLYFVAYDIRKAPFKAIFDKRFRFSNGKDSKEINTVSDFDMDDFLDYCSKRIERKSFNMGFDKKKNKPNRYEFSMKKIQTGGDK